MSGDLKERIEGPGIAERVAAGVAFLDEHNPGWDDRIDLTRLILSSPCQCVLGQLFGGYEEAVDGLGLDSVESRALGFNAFPAWDGRRDGPTFTEVLMDEFARLDAEWKRVIAERRAER